jgi:hypothetical protein
LYKWKDGVVWVILLQLSPYESRFF